MDFLAYGAAFLAGILTIVSPCVLPILPIVFGSASGTHRLGPAALALGLAIGFTLIALFVATIGFSLGIDADMFRTFSGVMLVIIGIVLAVPRAQLAAQNVLAPIGNWASARSSAVEGNGIAGQFSLGLLLGAVWSPCVGPTLGAASLLASQGEAIGQVAVIMAIFGVGAALPLLVIGTLGRDAMARMRGSFGATARYGKLLLGIGMVVAGALVLSGIDKTIEAWAVEHGPDWMTALSTRY